jgi:hypothetical protein
MKRLLSAAIVAMAASGPAWAQSSTTTGTGVGVARSTSSSQAISGQGGAGGRRRGNHHQQHRAGRSDGQERAGRCRTGLGRGRARNMPRVGFRRRRVCRDRIQLWHLDPWSRLRGAARCAHLVELRAEESGGRPALPQPRHQSCDAGGLCQAAGLLSGRNADRDICCGCTKAVGIGAKRTSRTIYEYMS